MSTPIYESGDGGVMVTAYGAGPDLGVQIQFTVTGGGLCTYNDLTLEEAKELCFRLAAYLGKQLEPSH